MIDQRKKAYQKDTNKPSSSFFREQGLQPQKNEDLTAMSRQTHASQWNRPKENQYKEERRARRRQQEVTPQAVAASLEKGSARPRRPKKESGQKADPGSVFVRPRTGGAERTPASYEKKKKCPPFTRKSTQAIRA